MTLSELSNRDLLEKLSVASTREHEATVTLLEYLGEVDARRLYLEQGYSSMYAFMTEKLSYSEYCAITRINSARSIRRFPLALKLLRYKKVTLSTLSLISGTLTPENSVELLSEIQRKTKREVESILTRIKGKEVKRTEFIKPILVKSAVQNPVQTDDLAKIQDVKCNLLIPLPCPGKVTEQVQDKTETELSYKLSFVVSKKTFQKLERVKSLLSGKFPKGIELSELFDEVLELALKKIDRENRSSKPAALTLRGTPKGRNNSLMEDRKSALNQNPIAKTISTSTKRTRYIPKSVKREVFSRDGGQCTFCSPDGTRCTCKWNLHIDHVQPFALGGEHSLENLRLLCSAHNQFYANAVFG